MVKIIEFSSCLIFRPLDLSLNDFYHQLSAVEISERVRKNPEQWEMLLMKQKYGKHLWDTFGGLVEENETPDAALERELKEESGYSLRDHKKVTIIDRPYNNGKILRGHIYVVIPTGLDWLTELPKDIQTEEVEAVDYFKVLEIDSSEKFLPALSERILAFLEGGTEGDAIDYLDSAGSKRLSSKPSYY